VGVIEEKWVTGDIAREIPECTIMGTEGDIVTIMALIGREAGVGFGVDGAMILPIMKVNVLSK